MAELIAFVGADEQFRGLARALEPHGFDARWCDSWTEARALVTAAGAALVVAPAEMGLVGASGQRMAAEFPGVELILLAPGDNMDEVLEAVEDTDAEFLTRPDDEAAVVARLRRAVRHRNARLELNRLRREVEDERGFESILGTSSQMQAMFELLDRASATRASVLITGESGTGKELVARALHNRSQRADHPFVAVNCSAVPDSLLESELFGHVKGAFTDAKEARSGLFVKASGGTLFLDEIGDMPPALQPKLLRALQERTVRPVGGDAEVNVDVRLIAATHRDLETAVAEKTFREDLFYRLNVIHIEVPPLRDRGSDILLMAERFVLGYAGELGKAVTGISRAAARRLLAYRWPGNVRELQNCLERAVALTRDEEIQLDDLPPKIRESRQQPSPAGVADESELVTLDEVERRYIKRVLAAVQGNKKAAARILGLDRKTLYRKVERYQIGTSQDDSD
jgi:two-component system response regulator HydG